MKKPSAEFIVKLLLVAAAAFFVFNFAFVNGFITKLFKILQPVIIGVVLALAMSVPLSFFERKVFKNVKNPKIKELFCLSLTFLIFGGIVALLAVLIIPQGVKSVKEIIEKFSSGTVTAAVGEIKGLEFLRPALEKAYKFIVDKIADYVPQIINLMQSLFTGLYNVLFGIVVAIMLITGRKEVKSRLKKAIGLLFKDKNIKVHSFLTGATEKFSKYLGGQLTEACILGFACYFTMLILKVPYAALVSLIVGFMNLIPILGAYIAGTIGTVIVFAASPDKALVFLIAVIILQQIEGFTTYPVIVGKYVGLSGFWITVSIIICGGIFGFWGMFLGVPTTAFLFDLFDNYSAKKNAENAFFKSLRKQ